MYHWCAAVSAIACLSFAGLGYSVYVQARLESPGRGEQDEQGQEDQARRVAAYQAACVVHALACGSLEIFSSFVIVDCISRWKGLYIGDSHAKVSLICVPTFIDKDRAVDK